MDEAERHQQGYHRYRPFAASQKETTQTVQPFAFQSRFADAIVDVPDKDTQQKIQNGAANDPSEIVRMHIAQQAVAAGQIHKGLRRIGRN